MKNIVKAIVGVGATYLVGKTIYYKGKCDGVEDCKNAAYKAIAEDSLNRKTKHEKEESK